MTRGELLSRMDGRELRAWELYSQYEPLRDEQMAVHFARLMALLINMNKPKNRRAVKPVDLIQRFWTAQSGGITDPKDILQAFQIIAAGMEGRK